jgi:transcriptional regulator with XRE-family HTH domain
VWPYYKDVEHPFLRDRRKTLGISQADLAEVCGVTQGTISHWESGTFQIPVDQIVTIADYLDMLRSEVHPKLAEIFDE